MEKTKSRIGLLSIILLFLLLSGCAAAGPSVTPSVASWLQLGFIAVFTGFMIIGIAYMVAQAFEIRDLQLWVKEELYQAVFTVLIMGFLLAIIGFIDSSTGTLAPAFGGGAGGGAAGVQGAALGYVSSVLNSYASLKANLESVALGAGEASAFSTQCSLLGPWLHETLAPCMELGLVRGPISTILSGLSASFLAMEAQRFILLISKNYMISLLFPLGVLLRCFAFTRRAGGALIAISVGFYAVFSLMLLLDSSVIPIHGFGGLTTPSKPHVGLQLIWSPPTSCPGADALFSQLVDFGFQSSIVWNIIIVGVVGPVLNILVTLTFISWLASVLGSDIEVAELARIS